MEWRIGTTDLAASKRYVATQARGEPAKAGKAGDKFQESIDTKVNLSPYKIGPPNRHCFPNFLYRKLVFSIN
jgi:hypothetical protein